MPLFVERTSRATSRRSLPSYLRWSQQGRKSDGVKIVFFLAGNFFSRRKLARPSWVHRTPIVAMRAHHHRVGSANQLCTDNSDGFFVAFPSKNAKPGAYKLGPSADRPLQFALFIRTPPRFAIRHQFRHERTNMPVAERRSVWWAQCHLPAIIHPHTTADTFMILALMIQCVAPK